MRTPLEIEKEFAPRENLSGHKSFFLVGIGGAGMSPVAQMLAHRGYRVRGTDLSGSHVVESLLSQGIEVHVGHSGQYLEAGDALVLSDAIDLNSSPEVRRAREIGVPLYRRSQVLGWLLEGKKTIAVAGTHGKTTTTSMLAMALRAKGLDPTVVIGAEVPDLGGSLMEGTGEWAVVEACEAYDSLRDFDPYAAVLNNLEPDHLDFHLNWENLRDSVVRFAKRVPEKGAFVYNAADEGSCEVARKLGRTEAFGFEPGDADELAGRHIELTQKGEHNRANAAAALATLRVLGLATDEGVAAIEAFKGARRRQEVVFEKFVKGLDGEVTIIDDYGHHPTEVTAALKAIREGWIDSGLRKRLVVVFQPHLYSRTAPNIDAFATALDHADFVVLTDIYPAREKPMPGVSSFRIAERVTKPTHYTPNRHFLPREVAKLTNPGDVIVTMGAGNIENLGRVLGQELERFGKGPKILVAYGGDSTEREVSLNSGLAVYGAAKRLGYDVSLMDLTEEMVGYGGIIGLRGPNRPELVVLTTHGGTGENGALQGLLEFMHLNYTGPGVRASATAISKQATKEVYVKEGIEVAKGALLRSGDALPDWDGPYVVKPNNHGSTVGLSFVDDRAGLAEAVERCFGYDEEVLVEELLRGVEISVPVLGDRALPPVEVVPASGRYDFASKYEPGATEEICPARISEAATKKAMEISVRAHTALGCRGVTRTDMFVDGDRVVAVETNTVPGMTATSLVPKSAGEAGMTYDDLVDWIIKDGLKTSAK